MSSERTKIALIGTGGWGRQHARIFAQRPDVDFCAVMGRNRERAEARAAEYGVRAYTDIAEMLDTEKPDLVSLSLPNQGHFAPTLQVIEAGFPLLVEKPLVFDLAEADTLLEEARKRGLFFAINFNHRYAKPVQLAHEAIQSGRLGELMFATWRFGGEGGGGHPRAVMSWRRLRERRRFPDFMSIWRTFRRALRFPTRSRRPRRRSRSCITGWRPTSPVRSCPVTCTVLSGV